MIADLLFALWFFLPAGIANMTPVLAAHMPLLKRFNQPIDGGKTWRGLRVFGPHKTWRGLIAGTLAGMLTLHLQQLAYTNFSWSVELSQGLDYAALPAVLLGGLMGFGALSGDAIKSFFKRRINRQSGASWFPYDQLDYIAGGLLASLLVIRLETNQYIWIFVMWFLLHIATSYIGYWLKLKSQPI